MAARPVLPLVSVTDLFRSTSAMDEDYYSQPNYSPQQPLLDHEMDNDDRTASLLHNAANSLEASSSRRLPHHQSNENMENDNDDRIASLLYQAGSSLEASRARRLQHQSNIAIIEKEFRGCCCRVPLTPVRRMFGLLALFDFMLIFLMWIIYVQLAGKLFKTAFAEEVKWYDFKTSMFDFVLLGFVRCVLLLTIYVAIRANKWYMVAFTTTSSTIIAITKVLVSGGSLFKLNKNGQPMSYLIVIATFVLCWSELWHFDFQVIPTELRARMDTLIASLPTVAEDASYMRQQRARSEYHSFYTPYTRTYKGSSPSVASDSLSDLSEDQQEERAKDKMYIKEAKDGMHQTLRMFHINEGWQIEKEDADGIVIKSRQFDNIGKVYRCEATFDCTSKFMFKLMWENVDSQPAWNPAVGECQVVHKINKQTDILYVVANDAAGGLIAARDFVTLRRSKRRGPFYVCSGMATKYDLLPEKNNMIRGENGPGGYIMRSVAEDPNKCEFTWLLNTNLKGWIPQRLIDQSMTSVVADSVKSLRQHVSTLPR